MATNIGDISDGGLPRILSGLGQTSTGRVFDDGAGTVTVLSQGVKAPRQVKQMQLLLNQFGYKLTADGIFGAGTATAVKAVQTKLNMASTGIYDKALDERIVGMNQSGIIDARTADVQAVAAGQAQAQTTTGTTATPKPGTGLTVAPVIGITGQPIMGPGAMAPASASFMTKVKSKWTALLADPNFKYYAAGAAVVGVSGLIFIGGTSNPHSQQVNGYHKRKSRKSRRS